MVYNEFLLYMLRYAEVKWENPLVSRIKYFGLNPTHSVDVLYAKFLNIWDIWNCGGINYKLPFKILRPSG